MRHRAIPMAANVADKKFASRGICRECGRTRRLNCGWCESCWLDLYAEARRDQVRLLNGIDVSQEPCLSGGLDIHDDPSVMARALGERGVNTKSYRPGAMFDWYFLVEENKGLFHRWPNTIRRVYAKTPFTPVDCVPGLELMNAVIPSQIAALEVPEEGDYELVRFRHLRPGDRVFLGDPFGFVTIDRKLRGEFNMTRGYASTGDYIETTYDKHQMIPRMIGGEHGPA